MQIGVAAFKAVGGGIIKLVVVVFELTVVKLLPETLAWLVIVQEDGKSATLALKVMVVLLFEGSKKPDPAPFIVMVSPDCGAATEFCEIFLLIFGEIGVFSLITKASFLFSSIISLLGGVIFCSATIASIFASVTRLFSSKANLAAARFVGVRQVNAPDSVTVPPPPAFIAVDPPAGLEVVQAAGNAPKFPCILILAFVARTPKMLELSSKFSAEVLLEVLPLVLAQVTIFPLPAFSELAVKP